MATEHPVFVAVNKLKDPRLRAMFAGNRTEANAWVRTTQHRALAMRVLAVATTRIEFAWSAYVDAVPGMNHDNEFEEVLRHGSKLPEAVARAMFTRFKDVPYAD